MPADHVAALPASALPGVTSGDGGRDRVVTLVVLSGGQSYTGIAGGTVLTQPGWAGAASRVEVDATSGATGAGS